MAKKEITQEEEIRILENLFDNDTYFSATFGKERENIMRAISDDFGLLAYCNAESFGFADKRDFEKQKEEIASIAKDREMLKVQKQNMEDELSACKCELEVTKSKMENLQDEYNTLKHAYKHAMRQLEFKELKVRIAKDANYQLTDRDRELIIEMQF